MNPEDLPEPADVQLDNYRGESQLARALNALEQNHGQRFGQDCPGLDHKLVQDGPGVYVACSNCEAVSARVPDVFDVADEGE